VVDWWRKTTRGDRILLAGACAFVVALTVGYVVQKHRETAPVKTRDRPLATRGPAADLTAVQLGYRPGPQNTMLRRIDSLLELLEADCPANTRRGLAHLTMETIHTLARSGIAVLPNAVLGGVVGSTHIGATADCRVFFRRYAEKQVVSGKAG